jgi:hypothetical protein
MLCACACVGGGAGMNIEVSMPTGSLCSERNAMGETDNRCVLFCYAFSLPFPFLASLTVPTATHVYIVSTSRVGSSQQQ